MIDRLHHCNAGLWGGAMKLTHTQLRQLKKLARYVERVTDIDVVRQHSDRRHRVRLASEAQIAELNCA